MGQQSEVSPRIWTYVVVKGDASHEDDEGIVGAHLVELSLSRPLPLKSRSAALSAYVAEAVLDCFHSHQGIEVLDDFEITVLLSDGQVLEQSDQLDQGEAVEDVDVEQARYFGKLDDDTVPLPVLSMMDRAAAITQSATEDSDRIEAVLWLQRDAAYLYAMAGQARESGALASDWVATQIQESAAHSAALARSIQFGDDTECLDALAHVQVQRVKVAGEGGASESSAGDQRTSAADDMRRQAHRG